MKSKLLLLSLICVLLAGTSVFAQQDPDDAGIADTVALELTVDTVAMTAHLECWVFADNSIAGLSAGFSWADSPTDHFVMDSGYVTDLVSTNTGAQFVYESNDVSVTNANERFLIGAIAFGGEIPGDGSGRRLFGVWDFSITTWGGFDVDGIVIDTSVFSSGSEFLFSYYGDIDWVPQFAGKVFFGNPALDANDGADEPLPSSYALNQNYPNPFNPTTEIAFALPSKADVTLKIYNILGQEVTTLVDKAMNAGNHVVQWDASENATGVYFYKIEAGDFTETRKMMLLK